MKRRILYSLALLLLIVSAAVIVFKCSSNPAPVVKCSVIYTGSMEESIPASGKIRPASEVKVTSDVSGEIISLRCKEGDTVHKGDTIVLICQDLYISAVEHAQATLNNLIAQNHRARAELKKAESDFTRDSILFVRNAVSQAELESAEAALSMAKESFKASEYSIMSGEAEVKEALESLSKTIICAPMSGIVSRLWVEKGERVVGTSQMAGTELMRIADFSRMELLVDVSENDIVRIHKGDTAAVSVDAYPAEEFRGFVTKMANSAKNIDATFENLTNFEVRIEIAPCTARLLPGMSATASISSSRRDSCIIAPLSAVFSEKGQDYVWIADEDGSIRKQTIKTGIQDLSSIEVTEGLVKGDCAVSYPHDIDSKGLRSGDRIRIVKTYESENSFN